MAIGYINDNIMGQIADAIRDKGGAYGSIYVQDMPQAIINIPTDNCDHNFGSKYISSNGTYYASYDGYSGYDSVTVDVPDHCDHSFGTKTIIANGEYYASSDGYSGYSRVTVNVPSEEPDLVTDTFYNNGTYSPSNADGYSSVTVDVGCILPNRTVTLRGLAGDDCMVYYTAPLSADEMAGIGWFIFGGGVTTTLVPLGSSVTITMGAGDFYAGRDLTYHYANDGDTIQL